MLSVVIVFCFDLSRRWEMSVQDSRRSVLPEHISNHKIGWDDVDLSIFGHKSKEAICDVDQFKDGRQESWLILMSNAHFILHFSLYRWLWLWMSKPRWSRFWLKLEVKQLSKLKIQFINFKDMVDSWRNILVKEIF